MELLIEVIIAAAATAYLTELISTLLEALFPPRIVKMILTPIFAFLACWAFGIHDYSLVVCTLAAGFFSVSALHLLNRPATIQQVVNRR
jgi:hypothetical protein